MTIDGTPNTNVQHIFLTNTLAVCSLNVSLTRSRNNLCIVGCAHALRSSEAWNCVLQYLASQQAVHVGDATRVLTSLPDPIHVEEARNSAECDIDCEVATQQDGRGVFVATQQSASDGQEVNSSPGFDEQSTCGSDGSPFDHQRLFVQQQMADLEEDVVVHDVVGLWIVDCITSTA